MGGQVRDHLRTLHSLTSGPPVLRCSHGMQLMVHGQHAVQFASDADAVFYTAAYSAVPALLNELDGKDALLKTLDNGALAAAERRAAALEEQLSHHKLMRVAAEETGKRLANDLAQCNRRARALAAALKGIRQ